MDVKTVSKVPGNHPVALTLGAYAHVLNDHKWAGINLMEELYAIHQTPPQNLAYPVVVTPDINGYHFAVPDFPEINFLAPEMDSGVSTVTQTLRDAAASMQFPPAATLATEIPLLPGQFILQIVL